MNRREDYFQKLLELMDTLRGPGGCPWDQEQTRETLKPLLVEEAFEVLEALDGSDSNELCDELGDLLFQVIFHSRIAREKEEFDIHDVCRRSYEKMVRRHPHVFGDEHYRDSGELLKHWEDIKAAEKKSAGGKVTRESLLDGIPEKIPALYSTYQMSSKAARVGFDWNSIEQIRDKVVEEFEELQDALRQGEEKQIKEEVGDLLFAALNIARYLQIDPENGTESGQSEVLSTIQSNGKTFCLPGESSQRSSFGGDGSLLARPQTTDH